MNLLPDELTPSMRNLFSSLKVLLKITLLLFLFWLPVLNSFGQFGAIDPDFSNVAAPNDEVSGMALQPDGKILISGNFTKCGTTTRNRIARLNSDGILDSGFDPGTGLSNNATQILVLQDGKILLAGNFGLVQGTGVLKLARLFANGLLDTSFHSGSTGIGNVLCVAQQPDGKILVGGSFTNFNGVSQTSITRVLLNGRRDTSFHSGAGAPGTVESITLEPDGKILIAGDFLTYNGVARTRVARLLSSGVLDVGFDPGTGASNYIMSSKRQPDGAYILAGEFSTFNNLNRKRIVRLFSNGTVDPGFDPGTGANNVITCSSILPDGKTLVGGLFVSFNGSLVKYLTCLNPDGSLVQSFNAGGPGLSSQVLEILVQPDGKILVGGLFTSYNGISRNRILRILGQSTTELEELFARKPTSLFPNPAFSQTSIQNTEATTANYIIRDLPGKPIAFGKILSGESQILEVKNWTKGIYTVEIQTSGKRRMDRLVIN